MLKNFSVKNISVKSYENKYLPANGHGGGVWAATTYSINWTRI